jgi:hypothetical protein
MSEVDEKLVDSALKEINRLVKEGVIPVDNGHLRRLMDQAELMDLLVLMRHGALISGTLVTAGARGRAPQKMLNIRLTYTGLRRLKTYSSEDSVASDHGQQRATVAEADNPLSITPRSISHH